MLIIRTCQVVDRCYFWVYNQQKTLGHIFMYSEFLTRSFPLYQEALPAFIKKHFNETHPELTKYLDEFINNAFEAYGYIDPGFVIKACWYTIVLCLDQSGLHNAEIHPYLTAAKSYTDFFQQCFNPWSGKEKLFNAFRASSAQVIVDFKATFTDWELILDYPEQSLHQHYFIASIEKLTEAFPNEYKVILEENYHQLEGFCKGLTLAFEEAYIQKSLKTFLETLAEICGWNQNITILNAETKDKWFKFIRKISLYQTCADAYAEDIITKPGSKHFFKPVSDRRSMSGHFDFGAVKEIFENLVINRLFKNGFMTISYHVESAQGGHILSVRKLDHCWYVYNSNNHDLIYFDDLDKLSSHLTSETACYASFTLISFDKKIVPNKQLLEVANHDNRFFYQGAFDIFKYPFSKPIVPLEKIISKKRFEHFVIWGLYTECRDFNANILHFIFNQKLGQKFLDFFQYAGYYLALAMQKIDKKGYTPFVTLFLSNPEVAEPIIDILVQYPEPFWTILSIDTPVSLTGLHALTGKRPDLLKKVFNALPQYKAELIELFNNKIEKYGRTPRDILQQVKGEEGIKEFECLISNQNSHFDTPIISSNLDAETR